MANPLIINAVVEIVKHAFQRRNLKSKTTIAAAAVAASTTAAAQAGASPGATMFPEDPRYALMVNAAFYLFSAILFFFKERDREDNA